MADPPIRVLELFAGIGGLSLAVHRGAERVGVEAVTVCYVEGEPFGAACLVAAIERQALAPAPIWLGDVREFDGRPWAGEIDLVAGGWPCQPASHAGARKGQDDERWLWPEVARVARAVRPRYLWLENVPGLLTVGECGACSVRGTAIQEVAWDLAEMGFSAEWGCVSASDVGAPHRRERWFCLAYRSGAGLQGPTGTSHEGRPGPVTRRAELAYRDDGRQPEQHSEPSTGRRAARQGGHPLRCDQDVAAWPPRPDDAEGWRRVLAVRPDLAPALPCVRGVADGLPGRVDQLRALGNAVVPAQGALAFSLLWRRIHGGG